MKSDQLVILGSSGFIGSEIVRSFRNEIEVIGIDQQPKETTRILSSVENLSLSEWQGKTSPQAAIVFAVGKADVQGSLYLPNDDYQAYVAPLAHLLDLVMPHQRIILISSAAVYSGLNCPHDGFREDQVLKSASVYGWHRILAEFILQERFRQAALKPLPSRKSFLGFDIIRPFSVFGADLRRQVIYDTIQRLKQLTAPYLKMRGTGKEIRDFVHVSAIPSLIRSLLRQEPSLTPWNLGSGISTTIEQLTQLICDQIKIHPVLEFNQEVLQPTSLFGNLGKSNALFESTHYSLQRFLPEMFDGTA